MEQLLPSQRNNLIHIVKYYVLRNSVLSILLLVESILRKYLNESVSVQSAVMSMVNVQELMYVRVDLLGIAVRISNGWDLICLSLVLRM